MYRRLARQLTEGGYSEHDFVECSHAYWEDPPLRSEKLRFVCAPFGNGPCRRPTAAKHLYPPIAGCGNTQRSEDFHEARRLRVARRCRRRQERAEGSRGETPLFRERHPPRKGNVECKWFDYILRTSTPDAVEGVRVFVPQFYCSEPFGIYLTLQPQPILHTRRSKMGVFLILFARRTLFLRCLNNLELEKEIPFPLKACRLHQRNCMYSLPREIRTHSCAAM